MQKNIEQAGEWQAIWERNGLGNAIIDLGRTTYNYFFRRVLKRYITSHTSMLELGCGRASLSLSLCAELKRLFGVDISSSAVQQAAEKAMQRGIKNARFWVGDCTEITLEEKFDFVWSQGLIEHFEDPLIVVREHYRALKQDGVALISVPYRYSYHTLWYVLTRPRILHRFWPWTEQRFFNATQLMAVGKAITPHTRTFFLRPFPLGIIFLELRRPKSEQV